MGMAKRPVRRLVSAKDTLGGEDREHGEAAWIKRC